jgi:hypothetical protein
MPDSIPLGRLAGLTLSARTSSIYGSVLLWAVFTVLGWLLWADFSIALLFGLLCTLFHWLADLVHQLGHARAARSTGFPMTGVRAWFIFSQSLYPEDEEPLPGSVHTRRALGGPIASILFGAVTGVAAWLVFPISDLVGWALIVMTLDSWLVFGFGAFLPLGFTDGSTLLAWWGK